MGLVDDVARLVAEHKGLKELVGEILATITVNRQNGTLKCSSREAEINWLEITEHWQELLDNPARVSKAITKLLDVDDALADADNRELIQQEDEAERDFGDDEEPCLEYLDHEMNRHRENKAKENLLKALTEEHLMPDVDKMQSAAIADGYELYKGDLAQDQPKAQDRPRAEDFPDAVPQIKLDEFGHLREDIGEKPCEDLTGDKLRDIIKTLQDAGTRVEFVDADTLGKHLDPKTVQGYADDIRDRVDEAGLKQIDEQATIEGDTEEYDHTDEEE